MTEEDGSEGRDQGEDSWASDNGARERLDRQLTWSPGMVKLHDTNGQLVFRTSPCGPLTDVVYVFTVASGVGSVPAGAEAEVVCGHERRPLVRLLVRSAEGVGEDEAALGVAQTGPG